MQVSNQTEITDSDKSTTDIAHSSAPVDTSSIQTSIDVTVGLERCITVTVPAEKIDPKVDERIQQATKTINLKGFRKGKAPFSVVKKRFGASLRQEVLNDAINETFQQAITAEDVKPAGQPDISLKELDEGKDLQYTATFEIYPNITLGDFAAIKITRTSAEITESDVDKMVQQLREQQSTYEPVTRAAEIDDEVTIDYSGSKGGEPFSGGQADDQKLVLGSNSMIPGFEEAIVGMTAGEEKVAPLTFPEDYNVEELKGADVEFTIKLKQVSERILPPLDEPFLAKFGVANGDMDKFRENIRANMKRELDNTVKDNIKKQVVDELIDNHELELPKTLVASEIEVLRQQMASQFGAVKNQNLDLKAIFPDDSLTEQAERRVSFVLLASEIAKLNNVQIDQDRVKSAIKAIAETYEQPDTVVNYYYQNPQLLQQVQSSILEDQIIEIVSEQAQINEEELNYFELVKRR